jgi:hypothetical protein
LDEKRAILASWASDACAVNSAPALRRIPNGNVVSYDDVVDALRSLDAELAETSRVGPRSVCSNEPGGASDGQTRRSLQ